MGHMVGDTCDYDLHFLWTIFQVYLHRLLDFPTLPRSKFLFQVSIAIFVVLIANVAIQQLASRSIPRQLLRRAMKMPFATDIFLGNSTMEAGLIENAYSSYDSSIKPLNLGLGYTSSVEHLVLLKHLNKRPERVFYGFFDTQLTDRPIGDFTTLTGNKSVGLYTDIETVIRHYAPNSWIDASFLRLVANVPVLLERHTVWSKVELIRRSLSQLAMQQRTLNQFGDTADFVLLESDPREFVAFCTSIVEKNCVLSEPILEIITCCKLTSSRMTFIEMPMPSEHRRRFYETSEWQAYRRHLSDFIEDKGCLYLNASNWVEDEGFSDILHLNAHGADIFSKRLALECLPKVLP